MKICLLFLSLVITNVLFGQNTILKGKVLDGSDRFSLPGATLRLDQSNRYTVSDDNGNFEFLNIPEGTNPVVNKVLMGDYFISAKPSA